MFVSHHGGLIDGLSPDGENSFLKRMGKNDEQTYLSECTAAVEEKILRRLKTIVTPQLIQNWLRQISDMVNSQSESCCDGRI